MAGDLGSVMVQIVKAWCMIKQVTLGNSESHCQAVQLSTKPFMVTGKRMRIFMPPLHSANAEGFSHRDIISWSFWPGQESKAGSTAREILICVLICKKMKNKGQWKSDFMPSKPKERCWLSQHQ